MRPCGCRGHLCAAVELVEACNRRTGIIADPPIADVYEAVADPDQLSAYFTTGGAHGRLETGRDVSWDFADFPGRFPVNVVEAHPPHLIVIEWEGDHALASTGRTRVTFEFAAIDDGARTLVTISESAWSATPAGARSAFDNCEGWTSMLQALKALDRAWNQPA
ncbi:SRPBCC domain-containing protein [Microbacterium amylolyticum]|uniref:Uncharacterized protein YndB with AHSA1/START domain n=1 Tax=Microbacterium amylolyticum TaxID=936337 RepID=A0ABS4ZJM2_9MICO|nr:SRPBCC domain-containing protein [Microbacterium amylolyticum]MBP2437489.1 uncharacterized protein YndB with AHSA1/START domain [Microbacterium amylolyticum]